MKKPVMIEAFRIGIDYIPDWFMDRVSNNTIILHGTSSGFEHHNDTNCDIQTLEGIMHADYGDYIIKGVKDGIYVYDWNYGTGNATFTIQPQKCYRIRDGKLCEPLRVNVVTGNVFQTLFDIDAVGDDLQFFSGTCGKYGQSLPTATGGPTIRVKKLTIN